MLACWGGWLACEAHNYRTQPTPIAARWDQHLKKEAVTRMQHAKRET